MIRSISNITDITVIDQNEDGNLYSFSNIEFNDDPIGSGAFGAVYKVQAIDGLPKDDFVIKIFAVDEKKQHAYDVIKLLHEKIKIHQRRTKVPIYHDIPGLAGLPFLGFKGFDNIEDKHCVAFIMYDLNVFGFEYYGNDNRTSIGVNSLELKDKLYIAYELVKTVDFLHRNNFIHSDLNEHSLFFNPQQAGLALIDYDSGFHFDNQDKSITIGKISQWISGKFRDIIRQSTNSAEISTRDRLYEEYWILANAIFEIVFGVMPYFFLKDAEGATKEKYLSRNTWPEIDYSSDLCNSDNIPAHKEVVFLLSKLKDSGLDELIETFIEIFNKGYKKGKNRLSPDDWKVLLHKINAGIDNYPLIKSFSSNKENIHRAKESVNFMWQVKNFNRILINGSLIDKFTNKIHLSLDDDSKIVIEALNDFNNVNQVIEISAVKIAPEIVEYKTSKKVRDSLDPVMLSWDVTNADHVLITNIDGVLQSRGLVEVLPTYKTEYELTAVGFFNEKVTAKVEIDILHPRIIKFNWEINLNEGIDNVDLNWETANAQEVYITPGVGEKKSTGLAHIKIPEKTIFKLIAKGLFSETESELTAYPFPVPVIEQMLIRIPNLEMNTLIKFKTLDVLAHSNNMNNVEFTNVIKFKDSIFDSINYNSDIEFSQLLEKNKLIVKDRDDNLNMRYVYNKIKKIIQEKISIWKL